MLIVIVMESQLFSNKNKIIFLLFLKIIFKVCIMTATITEVASNTATANILLPILSEMVNRVSLIYLYIFNFKMIIFNSFYPIQLKAVSIRINPLFLMLPATVTCSYAFMLPVATPPNAIVFSAAHMNPVDMVSIIKNLKYLLYL